MEQQQLQQVPPPVSLGGSPSPSMVVVASLLVKASSAFDFDPPTTPPPAPPPSPGGPWFNFANFGKSEAEMNKLKLNEIKNGRLVSLLLWHAALNKRSFQERSTQASKRDRHACLRCPMTAARALRPADSPLPLCTLSPAGHACHVWVWSAGRHHGEGPLPKPAGGWW